MNINGWKLKYYVKETRQRTLIISLGLLSFNKTYYVSKFKIDGNYQYYSYVEDYLGIDRWLRMSLSCEVKLINNALDNATLGLVKTLFLIIKFLDKLFLRRLKILTTIISIIL